MNLFKQIIYKGYVIGLMAFTVWYGTFMYSLIFGFEGKDEAAESFAELTGVSEEFQTKEEEMFDRLLAEQGERSETNLGFKVIDQPFIEGRFHHVGFEMQRDMASMCVRCHGNVPHDKSKELRSFLNMHAFYLACESCHANVGEEDTGSPLAFRWYDKDTGAIVPNPLALGVIEDAYATDPSVHVYPTYGNYGAKIVPGVMRDGEFKLLHGPKEMSFVSGYIQERERLMPEKKSQMETVIHRKVREEPIECVACHTQEEPFFSFAALGYPPTRERELTNTAAVGMIKKYKQFYIPSFLHPGGREN